ncbi:glycosyl transferase family 2 [Thermodesulfobacterium geofontis OPF15]|jgi:GT2 family glycosyltransferase|uniref:Glycosyl transferase family 2 n=1 Tax=Thermodesulfobacterium geofontis (strain OPF15) TaxID=795359 RepID=F8C3J8_THEGP|nr:glycosyltransferase family 2 protein [Thermodesulfobacterium geofontis]AEH22447.1 glycosyl transferase family 2 [Thermodesulfobacterium geofontis OPF15]
MSDKVCAVVVTYNRKNLLLECLKALRKQTRPIQGLYLIDNASTDGTPELLLEKGYITELPPQNIEEPWEKEFIIQNLTDGEEIKLYYVRMHENTGGAGGFYEGVKRGYEKGYDWLWLMDDDAEPKEDALESLSIYFKNSNIVGLAGSVLLPNRTIAIYHRGKINFKKVFPLIQIPLQLQEYQKQTVEIDMASFVGLLVRRNAIEKIGFPKKDFYIHHDDIEYCIRLRSIGKILLVPKSIIFHKKASKTEVEKFFLGRRKLRKNFSEYWLTYYGIRNLVWLGKRYSKSKTLFYYQMFKFLLRQILGIILLDDNKLKRIKFIINAYIDGLQGKFDNKKPKRLLYEK